MKKIINNIRLPTAIFLISVCLLHADDAIPSHYSLPGKMAHADKIIALNPMIGWNHNTLSIQGNGKMPPTKLEDGEPEYGLTFLYITPRFAVNNITFYTPPYDKDIWGNVLNFSLYGNPVSSAAWSIGGVWTWHKISTPHSDITLNAPFLKVGIIFHIPQCPLSINPYIGYGKEYIDSTSKEYDDNMMLYGVSANAMLHKLHINIKYVLYDNIDSHKTYDTASLRIITPISTHMGWSIWGQYMEQVYTEDLSVMTGPIWLF